MEYFPIPDIHKKTAEEIIDLLRQPAALPGSTVWETRMAVLQVRIAEKHEQAAREALLWAKLAIVPPALAVVIALVALLVPL